MIEYSLTLLLATFSGLVVGLMPGLGSSALMIAALPLLYTLPPEVCIIYYAVGIQASQFSGSVSAINFGMLGELTSYPALAERRYILKNNLQKTALKFTAIGSIVSCIIPILMLYPMINWFKDHSLIMRTDFLVGLITFIIIACIFYKLNRKITNAILIGIGIFISQIGMTSQGAAERTFMTFDQPWLYGGIPMISLLGGLIAVPLIAHYIRWNPELPVAEMKESNDGVKFPWLSSLRGGLIGLFTGLIPAVGTQIGSNFAWAFEKRFFPKETPKDSLARLTSAESANNGSQITVLVPLLVIGLAIVPSEMILLSVLETKFWLPGESMWTLSGLGFYEWLIISLIVGSIISFLCCYTFLSLLMPFLKKNLNLINKLCIIVLTVAVFYSGSLVESQIFFIASFAFFSLVAVYFKRINFIPLIAGYFLGDILIDSIIVLGHIYG